MASPIANHEPESNSKLRRWVLVILIACVPLYPSGCMYLGWLDRYGPTVHLPRSSALSEAVDRAVLLRTKDYHGARGDSVAGGRGLDIAYCKNLSEEDQVSVKYGKCRVAFPELRPGATACFFWWVDQPCVVIETTKEIYGNPLIRDTIARVAVDPCRYLFHPQNITEDLPGVEKHLYRRHWKSLMCEDDSPRPYFDVAVVVKDSGLGARLSVIEKHHVRN